MSKILFAVDGSTHADKALAQWLAQQGAQAASHQVHLLSVQLPVDGNVRTFVNAEELNAYHRAEGEAALVRARASLEAAGVPYEHHIVVGSPADTICRFAAEHGVDEIVMGTHGRTGLMELLMGSVATQVSAKAKAKVTAVK